jgi:hypothetical protein
MSFAGFSLQPAAKLFTFLFAGPHSLVPRLGPRKHATPQLRNPPPRPILESHVPQNT